MATAIRSGSSDFSLRAPWQEISKESCRDLERQAGPGQVGMGTHRVFRSMCAEAKFGQTAPSDHAIEAQEPVSVLVKMARMEFATVGPKRRNCK